MDVVAVIVAILSLLMAGVALWFGRSSAIAAERSADAAEESAATSERSAAAAETSAGASTRAADAAERGGSLQETEVRAAAVARVEPIQWGGRRPEESGLHLKNFGPGRATLVTGHVRLGPSKFLRGTVPAMAPDETVTMSARDGLEEFSPADSVADLPAAEEGKAPARASWTDGEGEHVSEWSVVPRY